MAEAPAAAQTAGRSRQLRSVRWGAAVLAVLDLVVGVWASLFPRSFYTTFPGGPFRWIEPFGPDNAHLIADVGGAYLMMCFLLVVAARSANRGVVQVALAATLVQAVFHLVWHLRNLHMLDDPVDAIGLVVVLAVAAALPALLLVLTRASIAPPRRSRDAVTAA